LLDHLNGNACKRPSRSQKLNGGDDCRTREHTVQRISSIFYLYSNGTFVIISEKEQKLKAAKLIGSVYFLGLALINFYATFYYSKIHVIDVIILLFGFLPLLIKHRSFSLIFGLFAGAISLYLGFACFTFNLNPQIHTSQTAYNMGYLLSVTAFLSSLLLVYVGLNTTRKREMESA